MRTLAILMLLATSASHADVPGPLVPLSFLAGSCWAGELPAQGAVHAVDTHCFAWVYGQHYLRDTHTVRFSDGRPDYVGETTYWWNAADKQLDYLYIENQGGVSQGTVTPSGDALLFPATDEVDGGKAVTYRSRWQKSGPDSYDAVTEFKMAEGWKAGWAVHMKRAAQ